MKAEDADQSGLADAVQAINNLVTAQVRKVNLIDVKGLGRPKEFSGKEEDFQQWSKKTEAFFAGVIQESEMMVEWLAEQEAEIKTELIDLEFLPTSTHKDRGVQTLSSCCSRGKRYSWLSQVVRQLTLSSTRGRTRWWQWRRLQKRYDPTTGGSKRNMLRTIMSPARSSLLELQAGIERWESCASCNEKKMKDKLDDEVKLAGLEAMVLEGLEKHLILKTNRVRTFEDARLEIVT